MSSSKYINFFAVALRSIRNDKFGAFCIAVPLSLIIAIVSALTFYIEGVERDAFIAAESFPDILLQQQVGGRTESLFLDRYYDILTETPGIASYEPRVWGYINYVDTKGVPRAFVIMGLNPEFFNSGRLFSSAIKDGRALEKGDTDKALVGAAIAKAFNSGVGDTIEVLSPGNKRGHRLEVVGTFDADVQIYTADLIIVPIATAREILGFYEEFECSDVLVFLEDPGRADSISAAIGQAVEGARPLTKKVVLNLTKLSFGQRSGYFHLLWFILLVNVLVIGWSVMSNLSHGKRKEIGILKAVGWDTQDIMLLKLIEVTFVGIFSVACGLLSGLIFMLAGAPGIKKYIIGWTEIYPDFPIPLYVDWPTIFLIIVLGILPLVAATLIPIWRLSIIDPIEIIRQ